MTYEEKCKAMDEAKESIYKTVRQNTVGHHYAERIVSELLSLEGDNWKIAVVRKKGELPEIPFNYEDECREYTSYTKALVAMRKDNYRQVIE